jgi:hypothetical protein
MGKTYDRHSVTIVVIKEALGLRKTIDADHVDCPDLIFTADQAQSLWRTLRDAAQPVSGASLGLHGDKLNAKGTYPLELKAALSSKHTSQRTGEEYTRNDAWNPAQLKAFEPAMVRLEIGFYGQPKLCAYLVPPVTRAPNAKARVIPQITRIDVDSPEGKAIAEKHAKPTVARINRR